MKRRIAVGWIAGLALGLLPSSLPGQTTVHVGVVIGFPAAVAIPEREVIVVERVHVPRGRAHGWWKKHKYRVVTVYYDGQRYYRRGFDRPALRRVTVYERRGRYYIEHDRWTREQHRF